MTVREEEAGFADMPGPEGRESNGADPIQTLMARQAAGNVIRLSSFS